MKNFKRIITLCLALALCLSCAPAVFAAEVADATIDMSRKGSLTVYKYDLTNAEKDGVWDSSYVSTGVMDTNGVVDVLGGKRDLEGIIKEDAAAPDMEEAQDVEEV